MKDKKETSVSEQEKSLGQQESIKVTKGTIQSLIYVIRDRQVMIDSDLAMLYQVETGALNRAVKRNITRFPEEFRFQLTKDEYENLKSQIAISNLQKSEHGGRRKLPYVFTEQGIAMLSAVLHSDVAIRVSISIMNTFVAIRKFMANNALMFERINEMELKQMEYQKKTDEKFEKVFDYISENEKPSQMIFFNGQLYDAFSLIVDLVQKAEIKIVLVDNYVDIYTLNILAKKKEDVSAYIYTTKYTKLSVKDVEVFNKQYPLLELKYTNVFHDRFLIIDDKYAYHIGASIKDVGKKCFGINLISNTGIVSDILQRLELEEE